MRALTASIVTLATFAALTYAAGITLARYLSRGDERADDFQYAVIMSGAELVNRAEPLHYGRAITVMGGTRLDLRRASPAEGGAHLDVVTTLAGVEVIVRPEWRVNVRQLSFGGELDVQVTPASKLQEGAPQLEIFAETRIGGGLIVARGGDGPTG